MDIYLDIDGVILTKKGLNPAKHLREFLRSMIPSHDVHWITTHCKGDARETLRYLKQFLPDDVIDLLRHVKPTRWETLKTEAINFGHEFLWFDDYLLDAEQAVLRKNGRLGSWMRVDLDADPEQLLACARAFRYDA